MPSLGRNLREQVSKVGVSTTVKALREGIREKKIRREDYSLRETAQAFLGDGWYDRLEQYRGRSAGGVALRESETAVDASSFAAITGQLLIDTVREKYEVATLIGDSLFRTVPIGNGNLGVQREPGLRRVKDKPRTVNQGQPYPHAAFDGDYVDYPAPTKFGEICNVTMEMIFADLTGQAIESAESVGEVTGFRKEYAKLAVAAGLVNPYSWNGTAYNTYSATAAVAGGWANQLTDFALTDWRDMNRVEQLFVNLKDPATGKPIKLTSGKILTVPSQLYNVKRVVHATEIRTGNTATAGGTQTVAPNPLEQTYQVMASPHFRQVLTDGEDEVAPAGGFTAAQAESVFLIGDFQKAFVWRQVYPLKVTQAPPLNPLEFNQDIVLSVKASEFGVAAVRDPRYVARVYTA
jgi:hypothetical protein